MAKATLETDTGIHLFITPQKDHNHIFFGETNKSQAVERFKEFTNNPLPSDYFLFECEGRTPKKLVEIMFKGCPYTGMLKPNNMPFFNYLPESIVQRLVDGWNKSR